MFFIVYHDYEEIMRKLIYAMAEMGEFVFLLLLLKKSQKVLD
jgi:hypothetical protein